MAFTCVKQVPRRRVLVLLLAVAVSISVSTMYVFERDQVWSISAATPTTTAATRPVTNEGEKERHVSTIETGSSPATSNSLEFVHITKTAGSAIEKAAASVGIAWGACHYLDRGPCESLPNPPDFKGKFQLKSRGKRPSLWHVPLQYFTDNPFLGVATFTVVRNPYDRALSAYYDRWAGYKGLDKNNPAIMNRWIQDTVRTPIKEQRLILLPQHLYVYDDTKQIVEHVLHFESIQKEFATLMEKYKLPVVFPDVLFNERESGRTLLVGDFTNETLEMINRYAPEDFQRFGYQMKAQQDVENNTNAVAIAAQDVAVQ